MLSNAYFLAKFRFDTAENEPAKDLQNFAKFVNFADPNPRSAAEAGRRTAPLRMRCRRLKNAFLKNAFSKNAFSKHVFFENFANFWRTRSRLYQNEILQENMRSTAFFKLYKICFLLHRCNLKIFAKFLKFFANFRKFWHFF